jgi:Glycosyl hydrolase family 12
MGAVSRLALLFGLLLLAAAAAAHGRAASRLEGPYCGVFDTAPVKGGAYIYQQDEWNSTRRQCAVVSGTGFLLTAASFDLPTNGPPATYPSLYRGCHWGGCSSGDNGMPVRVGGLKSIRSTWRTKQPAAGAYDVAYDVWTNTKPETRGQPDGSEIMIWLASRGGVQPFGTQVATVRLAGASWQVWQGRQASWNIVSYRRVVPTRVVRNLDVAAFVRDSVARRATKPSWYVIDGEAGFEIWKGGKGLATTSFSFAVK